MSFQEYEAKEVLGKRLAKIEVGFPFAAWKPEFTVLECADYHASISLRFLNAIDRDTGRRVDLAFHDMAPLHQLGDDEELARFCRGMLQAAVLHEVDECLKVNGKRMFDPHAGDS